MLKKKSRLNCESLEGREMMAGDVSAYVSNGHLYVVEASGEAGQGQAVAVSQLSDGKLRVKGVASQDGGVSLVNGAAYQDFRVTGDLFVEFGGGNDNVNLIRNTAIKGININVSNAQAIGSSDKDVVIVDGIRTDNALSILTGAGNDRVQVFDSTIGNGTDAYDHLNIFTGAGQDDVEVFVKDRGMEIKGNLNIYTYSGNEYEKDGVFVQSAIVHYDTNVNLGNGDDVLDMSNHFSGDDISINAGAGNDNFKLTEIRAQDDFFVAMGEGNDVLDMVYLRSDELTIDGGAGTDNLYTYLDGYSRVVNKTGWEYINGKRVVPFTFPGPVATMPIETKSV